MKKGSWVISVVALFILSGAKYVHADDFVWVTENAAPQPDPMEVAGKEAAATEPAETSADLMQGEPQANRRSVDDSDGNPDMNRDKPTRFGVGYEYRMHRDSLVGRPDRPERVERHDRPDRPPRPGRPDR